MSFVVRSFGWNGYERKKTFIVAAHPGRERGKEKALVSLVLSSLVLTKKLVFSLPTFALSAEGANPASRSLFGEGATPASRLSYSTEKDRASLSHSAKKG